MKIRCAITDDEPLARKGIKKYVDRIDFLETAALCEDALELNQVLATASIDLIFLDINMPHLSGIEFLKVAENPPKVILTTAYPEYALEGYDLDILDYLLKPISFDRFFKASNKARQYFELLRSNTPGTNNDYFFLKCNKRLEKIHFADILFIESLQNYVRIHTIHEKLLCHSTLKNIKTQLPEYLFVQTHKSFIASIERVKAIEGNQLIIDSHKIPISKYMKEAVLKKITK